MSIPSHADAAVRAGIRRSDPLTAFRRMIAAHDALIRSPDLDNGRELAASRCAIYRGVMADWAERKQAEFGYERPFAVVALGGTGRDEMTPCSDTDFAFLFDDAIDRNPFLEKLQRETVHGGAFARECGFSGETLPFNLDDMPELEGKQLNAFLDMQPVYDPHGLGISFRERIRATFDPFEHFLHISQGWRERTGAAKVDPEMIASFDIKNNGLRVFLAGVWSLGGEDFRHSREIYAELSDPRTLEAYAFLLRIRAYIHLRRGTHAKPLANGTHPEDQLKFDDFLTFGDLLGEEADEEERFEFANAVRGRLLTARRRVARFTWGVIGGILRKGRPIARDSAIVYGIGGLRDESNERHDGYTKSRVALRVLLVAQRHELPVDLSELERTFEDAGDWLEPVPELAALFYETRGSLAKSLAFLAQLPDALERLFPGFSQFESSLDERVLEQRNSLRGPFVREKIRSLEETRAKGSIQLENAINPKALVDPTTGTSHEIEAALLDADHLCAVKLALQTKRLPLTEGDLRARGATHRPLPERFSSGFSGIPPEAYYERFSDCGFSPKTLAVVRFLVEHRRTLREHADRDLMNSHEVDQLITTCGEDEMRMRALYVFSVADRSVWESEETRPARWANIRELFTKGRMRFQPPVDHLQGLTQAGFDEEQMEILRDFGRTFYSGNYSRYAMNFGSRLIELAGDRPDESGRYQIPPQVKRIAIGGSTVIAVATHDYPGIAASISGALRQCGLALSQAHLFSAATHGLALDFFHLAPGSEELSRESIGDGIRAIKEAIVERRFIGESDEAGLSPVARNTTIEATTSGLFRLRAETTYDVGELVFFLTCKAFRRLSANIYGLAAHQGRDHVWVSVYLALPNGVAEERAREIVASW